MHACVQGRCMTDRGGEGAACMLAARLLRTRGIAGTDGCMHGAWQEQGRPGEGCMRAQQWKRNDDWQREQGRTAQGARQEQGRPGEGCMRAQQWKRNDGWQREQGRTDSIWSAAHGARHSTWSIAHGTQHMGRGTWSTAHGARLMERSRSSAAHRA